MPYVDNALPFNGITAQSRHTSRLGAQEAKERALPQTVRYLRLLKDRQERGCTDWEAAELMGVERSTINARRVPLVKAGLVVAERSPSWADRHEEYGMGRAMTERT